MKNRILDINYNVNNLTGQLSEVNILVMKSSCFIQSFFFIQKTGKVNRELVL